MVDPRNIVVGGWDINNMNMADALMRARVVDYDLQQKLDPLMRSALLLLLG